MKKLLIVLFVFSVGGVCYSQEELFTNGEFIINLETWQKETTIKLVVERVSGTCWDENHNLTTAYTGGTSSKILDHTKYEDTSGVSTAYKIPLDMCWSGDGNTPLLGLGKYKITVYEEDVAMDYMYIDYRTSDFGPQNYGDIGFDYNDYYNKLYYEGTSNDVTSETIWNMLDSVSNVKTNLEPGIPTYFSVSSQNNHPRLGWNHSAHEDDYWTGYAIYRSHVALGNPPGTFSKIATVGKYTTSYIDNDFEVGQMMTVYYKVTTVNGTKESDPTLAQSINILVPKNSSKAERVINYKLAQNYPNPFNPSTTISYSIPVEELVTLRVYDSLGKEVFELVNEKQSAGEYSINFNGEKLPSGIYIYTISAGKYSSSKKLLLVK